VNGLGIILYVILWIVIPEIPAEKEYGISHSYNTSTNSENQKKDYKEVSYSAPKTSSKSSRIFIGIFLIALGIIFLGGRFFPFFSFTDIFPLALIVIGVVLLWNSIRK
jgi:hypothetical protein